MGAQLLLIPLLFVVICATFIVIQSCYQKIKMKAILKKKREAARVSLVNIMQLTNSTLINPTWTKNKNGGYVTMEEEQCTEKGTKCKPLNLEQGTKAPFELQSPSGLSSVVTLRAEQDSPPPYEDLYDTKGNPHAVMRMPPPVASGCNGHSCLGDIIQPPPEFSSSVPSGCCRISEDIFPLSHERDANITSSSQSPCFLQLPQVHQHSTTHLEPDPALERRNSSAVLYL